MNTNYDYTKAKSYLTQTYASAGDSDDIPSILNIDVAEIRLRTIKYPPSIRVMIKEGDEEVELTTTLQGVLCGKVLPPLCYKPSSKSISHIRNLRQHVKVTGLGLAEFDEALETIEDITKAFKSHVPTQTVTPMDCVPYEGDPSLEAHARYFTDRNLVPFAKNTPFDPEVDTHGVLESIQPDIFIHGPDNYVEYCRMHTEEDGIKKHVAYNPSLFKVGDVVEIAFSFVGVPVKDGGYRLMLNLRALTLLTAAIREESERKGMRQSEDVQYPALKCRRLYLQEDGGPKAKERRIDDVDSDTTSGNHTGAPSSMQID